MMKVSVIIPTYNRTEELKRSIQSVLNQTYENYDVIVVDDASTVDISQIVGGFEDDRLIYHRLSDNKGAAGARNEGVKIADGDLIAFQDSDDEWLSDKLAKQVEYLTEKPDFGMVYGRIDGMAPASSASTPYLEIISLVAKSRKGYSAE